MKTRHRITHALLVVGLLSATCLLHADGPPSNGGAWEIGRYTIDLSGGLLAGADFEVTGTVAQHDAGGALAGDGYQLQGGFWAGIDNPSDVVFKDGYEQ